MLKQNLKLLPILLIFLLSPFAAFAQQWKHYNTIDGLTPGVIHAIYEDSNGNLWFGGSNGVSRFDGIRFRTFTEEAGIAIYEDSKGNLWFGWSGVSRFDGIRFRTFTEEDGLALKGDSKNVFTIFEDSAGYLWFGTSAGVIRFDGVKFRNFTTKDGLGYNDVGTIYEDGKGNLWFGTSKNGIIRYDGTSFQNFTFDELGFPPEVRILKGEIASWARERQVYDIIEDRWGELWIATHQGLSRYDGHTFQTYTNYNVLHQNTIWSIIEDKSGHLWFSDGVGYIYEYDGKTIYERLRVSKVSEIWNEPQVTAILQDKLGNFWFATRGEGVKKYDGVNIEAYTTENGLHHNSIWSIYQDSTGNLWFGGFDGVSRYDSISFRNYTVADGLNSASGGWSRAVYEDRNGNLWGINQERIVQFDGKAFQVIKSGWPYAWLTYICEDRSGNLWFVRDGEYVKYNGVTWQHFMSPRTAVDWSPLSYFEDRQGRVWFVPWRQGIDYYDKTGFHTLTSADGLIPGIITSVAEDQEGYIWFGTLGNGACRYDGKGFKIYTTADGLVDNTVNWIFKDNAGYLWFATENGVSRYANDNARLRLSDGQYFETFSTEHGLAHKRVYYIYQDSKGNLWFCTMRGITRYDGKRFQTFTSADGLGGDVLSTWPDITKSILEDRSGNLWFITKHSGFTKYDGTCFQAFSSRDGLDSDGVYSMAEDSDGNLWFSTYEGITKHVPDKTPPRVSITKIMADKEYPGTQAVEFSSNVKRITFTYQGSDFRTRPGQMWYLFKLEGVDDDWQKPTRNEQIDYRNLKPGQYKFYVKAADRDLNYSEPASVTLKVISPFYLRATFLVPTISFGIILLAGFTVSLIFLVKNRRQIRAYERAAVLELRDAQKVQMSLMPETAPPIEGVEMAGKCVPANTVSGDFFDYVEGKSDNEIALVVADVTGKAMKGAMNAVMVDGILSMAAEEMENLSPAALMMKVNNMLKAKMERDMNVTMVIGVIRRNQVFDKNSVSVGTLILANAAHHAYPILLRDSEIEIFKTGGLPLGMRAGVEYAEEQFPLKSGDIVIFMTDGIIEEQNSEEQQYSDSERLGKTILQFTQDMSAEAMVETILNDAIAFGGGKSQRDDDMTVVVAKIC